MPKRSGFHLAYDVAVPYTQQQQELRPPFSAADLASLAKVVAPANGVVKMARETSGPDGYWVVIEHQLPAGDPDGAFVCSVFFHMVRPSQGGIRLVVGSRVSLGDVIGHVSPLASDDSETIPHQHYGIRKGPYAGDPSVLNPITNLWYYPGYTTSNPHKPENDPSHALVIQQWFNPLDFLARHQGPPPSPNSPPFAGFTMSAQGTTWTSGTIPPLRLFVPPNQTVPVSFSAPVCPGLPIGCSSDPDGTIASWAWTIDGAVKSTSPTFSAQVATGTHSVVLVVTDNGGLTAQASGSIVVKAFSAAALELVFDGSQNPRYAGAQFGDFAGADRNLLVGDSQSNVIMPAFYPNVPCGGGTCFTVISINPNTHAPNWEATDGVLAGLPFVGNHGNAFVTVGRNDEVYVEASPDQVQAYVNGTKQLLNWPYGLGTDATPNGSLFVGSPIADVGTGFVYASVGPVIGVCCPLPTPPSYAAVLGGDTGAELFKTGQQSETLAWTLGPVNDPLLVSFAAYSQILNSVTRYDRQSLAQDCTIAVQIPQSGVAGTPDGLVVAGPNGTLIRIDGACQQTTLTTLSENPSFLGSINGWVVGAFSAFGGSGSLVGVRSSDGASWTQPLIKASGAKVASQGDVLYVLAPNFGTSTTDLYLVDLSSGAILLDTSISSACSTLNVCGLVATVDGNVYINNGLGTQIYRVLFDSTTSTGLTNQPPTAGFLLSGQGAQRTSSSGSPLVLVAPAGQPASATISAPTCIDLSSGCSSDSDGTIVAWSWSVTGQSGSLSGLTQNLSLSDGSYIVTLTVTDNGGLTASASAVINVIAPPTLNATLVYDEGNPGVAFTQPVIDSTGALYVARSAVGSSCPSGNCNHFLQKIVPGSPPGGWTSAALSSDSIASLRRFVGPSDRVYIEGDRNTLWAFESNGTPSVGWPVHFPPNTYSNGGVNTAFTETFLDSTTGEVFGVLAPIGASNPDPSFFLALRADGSELWHLADPEVASFYVGPERDLYDLSFDRFARFDRETGSVDSSGTAHAKCQTPLTFEIYNNTTGNQAGIFSAFRSTLTEYGAACSAVPVFFTLPDRTNLSVWTIVSGIVLATDEPATGVTAPTDRQLVGIAPDGSVFTWRNTQFGPDLSGTTAQPVRAAFGVTALVLGIDGTDSNKRKLYLVNSFSGAVMAQPLDLTNICASCGVAVDRSGTIYINDMNSTKIWSIPWPIK